MGGQLPPDQALLTYRLWGAIHSNGGQLSPDQAAPLGLLPPEYEARGASYSGVKRPGGDLLRGAISSVTGPLSYTRRGCVR